MRVVMKTTPFSRVWHSMERFLPLAILTIYSIIALFPVVMVLMNSFKNRKAIFGAPFEFPTSETFSLIGYETVTERSTFHIYFLNSTIVTLVALILTLFIGAMAAFALAEYDFPGNALMALYLSMGIMIPIRLGTVGILRLMVSLKLVNTLTGLILIYVAQALPLTIFILSQFMAGAKGFEGRGAH